MYNVVDPELGRIRPGSGSGPATDQTRLRIRPSSGSDPATDPTRLYGSDPSPAKMAYETPQMRQVAGLKCSFVLNYIYLFGCRPR